MSKNKERSEVEYLRGENRRLKSENRHLKRLVKQSNRKAAEIEGLVSDAEDLKAEAEHAKVIDATAPKCNDCTSFNVSPLVSLPHKVIMVCSDCGKRSSVSK